MSALKERIESDIKAAMLARDEIRRDTLRMVLSSIKNKRIELGKDLDDAAVLGVLSTAVKSRRDSAEQYEKAGRQELADKELAEIHVIEGYLPKQLGEDETRTIVEGLVQSLGIESKKDIGRLMKAVMAEHKGQVDGKLVQRLAGELLS